MFSGTNDIFWMAQGSGMMVPETNLPTMPGYQGLELDESMEVPQFTMEDNYTTSIVLSNTGGIAQCIG